MFHCALNLHIIQAVNSRDKKLKIISLLILCLIQHLGRKIFDNVKANKKKFLIKIALRCIIVIVVVVVMMCFVYHTSILVTVEKLQPDDEIEKRLISNLNISLANDLWMPYSGDNITGWPWDIVPNIVHYVLFETHTISYVHMLSLLSVVKIQQPDQIIIHCDCEQIDEGDENWARVIDYVNITNDITVYIEQIEKPTEIYGRTLNIGNFDASDVTRFRILSKYGGIYLDNNVFVCQPLNIFFKYELTLNWDEDQYLGSHVLLGNRNARFLKFAIHADGLPTQSVLYKYPNIFHRVTGQFGVDAAGVYPYFYSEYHDDWQTKFYTFHMVAARDNAISWTDWCLSNEKNIMCNNALNDDLIKMLDNTFGEMGRYVLFESKKFSDKFTEITPQ